MLQPIRLTFTSICLLSVLLSSLLVAAQEKSLRYEDREYEDYIRTVQLYPLRGYVQDEVQAPAVPLGGGEQLILEFDDLAEDYEYYFVRLIHCNADWTPSAHFDIDILPVYNEFPITQYDYSFNTRTKYVHYRFEVPPVSLSGNYLLVVYRNQNRDDLILSRRFMVYEDAIDIALNVGLSTNVVERFNNQQLEFKITYPNFEILNPLEQVQVLLRKNLNWNESISNLQPTMVRESLRELEYRHFNDENNFSAGNEYRFFDIRTVQFNGQSVAKTTLSPEYATAILVPERPRTNQAYSEYLDINGQYVVNNVDRGDGTGDTDGEYVFVMFTLQTEVPYAGDVYVIGSFHNFNQEAYNKMVWDPNQKSYKAEIELKQGWYNYRYELDSKFLPPNYIEGDHAQTENIYEIFVYFRPIGGRGDRLVGYQELLHNNRRYR